MARREAARKGLTVAGVPLRASPAFLVVAMLLGWQFGRDVASAGFVDLPPAPADPRDLAAWSDAALRSPVTHPSTAWVLATGLAVALVYFLSVLVHELGHLIAARAVKVDVAAVQLDLAGGFVEMHDDDRLTAGRLASIVGAGPLVTAFIVLAAWAALRMLGWPLTGTPDLDTSAGVATGRVLSSAFLINLAALVLNLLPLRGLDGGHLLTAARLRVRRQGR